MDHYVKVYEWMTELGLKPGELLSFAVIYSFGKDGEWYTGSASYLAGRIGVKDRGTAMKYLSGMVDRGLLERRERWEGGEKMCDFRPAEKTRRGCGKNQQGACGKNPHHNNRPDSNRDNLKEINNKENVHLSVDDFLEKLK